MDAWLLIARVLLSGVFATAGLAKLWDLDGSRKAVADFGTPARLSRPIGNLLPIAELIVAALLVPARSAFWGGVAAFILLCGFTAVIAANLWRGRMPACRCFGQMRPRPIGPATLVRNGALAACAAGIVWSSRNNGAPEFAEWLAEISPMAIAIGGVVLVAFAAQSWLILHLFRQQGRLLLRLDSLEARLGGEPSAADVPAPELEIGAPAPQLGLQSLGGGIVKTDALWSNGLTALLVFSDPECGPCTALLPQIARWQVEHAGTVRIAVISNGPEEAVRRHADEYDLKDAFLQKENDVSDAYGANGTPAGVLIDARGTIASRVVLGGEAIAQLLAGVAGESELVARSVARSFGTQPVGAS